MDNLFKRFAKNKVVFDRIFLQRRKRVMNGPVKRRRAKRRRAEMMFSQEQTLSQDFNELSQEQTFSSQELNKFCDEVMQPTSQDGFPLKQMSQMSNMNIKLTPTPLSQPQTSQDGLPLTQMSQMSNMNIKLTPTPLSQLEMSQHNNNQNNKLILSRVKKDIHRAADAVSSLSQNNVSAQAELKKLARCLAKTLRRVAEVEQALCQYIIKP